MTIKKLPTDPNFLWIRYKWITKKRDQGINKSWLADWIEVKPIMIDKIIIKSIKLNKSFCKSFKIKYLSKDSQYYWH